MDKQNPVNHDISVFELAVNQKYAMDNDPNCQTDLRLEEVIEIIKATTDKEYIESIDTQQNFYNIS